MPKLSIFPLMRNEESLPHEVSAAARRESINAMESRDVVGTMCMELSE